MMTDARRAFDDERLNADLASILRLRDGVDTLPSGRRRRTGIDAVTKALRSPRASATIGISVFVAMLGTTAVLMHNPAGRPTVAGDPGTSAPARRTTTAATGRPVAAATIGDAETASAATTLRSPPTIVDASQGSKHRRSSLGSGPKVQSRRGAPSIVVAGAEGKPEPVVVPEDRGMPAGEPTTSLARIDPSLAPQAVKSASVAVSDVPAIRDDTGAEGRSALARRNSVAAIRALRRQW